MSLIGRGSTSIRKKDVAEQKSVALGFKKVVFAHKANAGETQIDLTNLNTPIEMSTNGFVNPPYSALASLNIKQFRNNLKIISSLSGILMDYMSYNVVSTNIIRFNGFTAAQDEVFTIIVDEAPATSLSVVDGKTIIASGTLLAGQTDFNIGTPIEINKNPTQHHGAVLVYLDRGLQYRKVGNLIGGDGDYIEVPVAGGLGSLIRFDAAPVDRFITVVSNGVVAERPDGSMTALIERVQGQIDQMIPTLAAVAGVPESTFQIAPNDVDLKQFGDTVLSQQVELDNHEARIDVLESKQVDFIWVKDGNTRGAVNTVVPIFTTVNSDTGNGVLSYSTSATAGAAFTALKRCKVSGTFSHGGAPTPDIGWYKNPTGSDLTAFTQAGARTLSFSRSGYGGGGYTETSFNIIMEIGDVVVPAATVNSNGAQSITITAEEL